MPSASDIILFPLKIVTKPFVWWRYGYERKVDEYKVEITYNLEFDKRPLVITKVIKCSIYEGKFRNGNDGIKRPARRAERSVSQVTHKIKETGEVIILPIPGYCKFDRPYERKEIRTSNDQKNRTIKYKYIPVKNKTKSFSGFSEKWIPSLSIVKFSEDDPDRIDRIERVISPKYYLKENARIKLKSYEFNVESEENVINSSIEVSSDENDSRFNFINGKGGDVKYPFGKYKRQDRGSYSLLGVFIYPQDIWSKIPKVNDYIEKITKENLSQEFFYMAENDEDWEGVRDAIDEMRRVTIGSYSGFSDYFGRYGINDIDPSIARVHTWGTDIMRKGKDGKWVVNKNRLKEWNKIVEKSNYRDYYYPFVHNSEEKMWNISKNDRGLLIIQRTSDGELWRKRNSNSREYRSGGTFRINDKSFREYDKTGKNLFYNSKTKELILPGDSHGIFLE